MSPIGTVAPAWGGPVDWATHLAAPWLVFALFFLPIYMGMIRVRLLETLSEPWITTARATASGLIPLPRAVASRPRVRLGLNVAVGAILIALLALASTHNGKSGRGITVGTPIKTVHVNWDDVTRLEAQIGPATEHGYLETHVTAVDFGPYGWRVHASTANKSPLRLRVTGLTAPPGLSLRYPHQPMSLIVQSDSGSGTRYLMPVPAREFAPALPAVLRPRSTWRGTFTGSDPVATGSLFYVGFGQFAYYDDPFGTLPFSTSTAKSATAP